MAVEVQVPRNKAGGGHVVETHEDGTNYVVTDGHLHVTGWAAGAATSVAVYAPGHWVAAKVVDKK